MNGQYSSEVFTHGRKRRFWKGFDAKLDKKKIERMGKIGDALFTEEKCWTTPDVRSRDRVNWILTCSKITELDLGGGSTCGKVQATPFFSDYISFSLPVPVILQYVHGPLCQHSHPTGSTDPTALPLIASQYCCSHRRGRESLPGTLG